ncbi:MAG: alpha-L-rhamnosidase [Litorilinea sp.]|nr:MAG: alpha-L-rhamnosidase [Litorilinea sp.]
MAETRGTIEQVTRLRCEYKDNPIGIDVAAPRLSWQLQASGRQVRQSAYQIQVAEDADALAAERDLHWDSGKVLSPDSIHQPYQGPPLQSGRRYHWRVRVWDSLDRPSAWSQVAFWEMGLLAPGDWRARWITPDLPEDPSTSQPCPMLRTRFAVDGAVRRARLYVTSLGLYECELNGQRVGDQVLTPGWTSYDHRLQYQTYDVTDLLQSGENGLGVLLGDGWYRGYLGFEGQRNLYGDKLALFLQLRIEYADGRVQEVVSDEGWRASTGPLLAADIYNGEVYDARLEKPGWSQAGYDDSDWAGVQVLAAPSARLVAPAGPPVRRIQELRPVAILHSPKGETIFDFGQNMVGWIRLRVQGPAGTVVTLRHAEVLDQEGNLYVANLRSARQTVTYTLKGEGVELYEPRFTFQGFRYVAVEGYPGTPDLDSLTGIVVHSDMAPTGHFACSDPLINQLQHNIVWGQKGNFVDVPTDCPQRDERLGWTGDAQVFIRTACFNMDVAAFFTKWLQDLAADQAPDGSVPFVVPDVLTRRPDPLRAVGGFSGRGSSAWGDAAVICPWTIYLCYGDRRILEQQYESMVGWVEFMTRQAGNDYIWDSGFHFGDWLAIFPEANPLMPAPKTSTALIATAFFAYSTRLLAECAAALGKTADAERYQDRYERIRAAFRAEFVSRLGRIDAETQTDYVLPLMFDLLSEEEQRLAVRRLVADIRARHYHLSTGFVGTPYLCHVLTRHGYLDVAYNLLKQRTFPSWLYPIKRGATTIWERWDGIKPDGSFQDEGMNSFNHYAYGAIGEWLYRVVAGIEADPAEPGYRHILIQPQPGGAFTFVEASLQSMYGEIRSAWRVDEAGFTLEVTVPANAWATVWVPARDLAQVRLDGVPLAEAPDAANVRNEGSRVACDVGSGTYQFTSSHLRLDKAWMDACQAVALTPASRLVDLLSDPDARAILEKHMGDGFAELTNMRWGARLSLEQVATARPDLIPPALLETMAAALARL